MHRPVSMLVSAALVLSAAGCVGGIDVGESSSGLSVCAKGAVVKGVDVSHYDGTIDWKAAHGGGIDFAIIKATENINFIDPDFATNWKNAGDNGVIRGAYHFFRPEVDATAQADYFIQNAGVPAAGDLPPTIDLEVTDNVAAATVASGALTFLARVQEKTGRTPIVYTSASFLSSIGSPAGFAAYTLWVANWQVSCPSIPSPPWSDWTFWQNASTGTVPGISSMVDTDQFNGSLADLQNYVNAQGGPDGGSGGGSDGGGVAPDGGSGGSGGAGGGGGDLGKSDTPPVSGLPHTSGGCSVAATGGAAPSWLIAALALALVAARGRRRNRARLVAVD